METFCETVVVLCCARPLRVRFIPLTTRSNRTHWNSRCPACAESWRNGAEIVIKDIRGIGYYHHEHK